MSNVTSYTYGAGTTGNPLLANDLLTITSPNAQPGGPDAGDATVIAYDTARPGHLPDRPDGLQTTFNYCVNAAAGDCMNPATGTGFVTVTDPDGNTTVYHYDQGTLAAQSDLDRRHRDLAEQDYVPDTSRQRQRQRGTLLDTATTDGDGNITTTSYDTAGNPRHRHRHRTALGNHDRHHHQHCTSLNCRRTASRRRSRHGTCSAGRRARAGQRRAARSPRRRPRRRWA